MNMDNHMEIFSCVSDKELLFLLDGKESFSQAYLQGQHGTYKTYPCF